MKVKSESEVAQSRPTLHDPMDCSPPGSSAQEILQERVLEWGTIAFSIISQSQNYIVQKNYIKKIKESIQRQSQFQSIKDLKN